MRDTMAHRGPDDSGIFLDGNLGLGHRRLSIIDLEGGHQPMSTPDGALHIVHNGEIYNFQTIRRELESGGVEFETRSDTEVILRAYEKWGPECVKRLHGIFAFGIWDARNKRLFIARDRLGIKPLFYTTDSSRFIFASEIKAFLKHPDFDRGVDHRAVDRYFSFGYIPAPDTIFSSVKKLLPAHYLIWENGSINMRRYWRFEPNPLEGDKSNSEWVDEFRDTLERAVARQMISDVPLGAFLSGGIDSSLIVWMMSRSTAEPVRTFTIGFGQDAMSEAAYAGIVADRFSTQHREFEVTPEAIDILPRLVWHLDEPFADSSALPTYFVSNITREEVTVALSGDGGDELFAGYTRHQGERLTRGFRALPPWARSGIVGALKRTGSKKLKRLEHVLANAELDFTARYKNKEALSQDVDRMYLYADAFRSGVGDADAVDQLVELGEITSDAGYIDRLTLFDLEFYLPNDMLVKVDKMSMASSLEVRVPFLDELVLDAAARIPARLKLRGFTTKYLLRRLAAEVLPGEITGRRKQGFGVPLEGWFRGRLSSYAREILLDSRTFSRGYLDRAAVESVIDQHEKGLGDRGHVIYALVAFELWNRVFLDDGGM
jgi:asparagine synthase (glutamine-hydrolysing)